MMLTRLIEIPGSVSATIMLYNSRTTMIFMNSVFYEVTYI